MQGLRLAAHIHYGICAGQRIFLDLEADRYFQLPAEEDRHFEALEDGGFVPASGCALLVRAGILTYSAVGRPIGPAECAMPASSMVEQAPVPVQFGVGSIAEVWRDLWIARRIVHRRRLPALLADARAGDLPGAGAGPETSVRQFLAVRKLIPFAPNCLRDSLALRRFLIRRRIGVQLIIGAKLYPFAAHCWLQHGEMVLNDSLSGAKGFAPILVL
ncbi:MAG TPA: lasso peptide biosynthesis B2 protein [Sphingomicrobium sp.]|nr:lasso peptide biosynthesis B2 protein [Sphingomicrobium sp.]